MWTNNLVAFLFGVGMYSVMAFLPEFLQTPKSSGYGFGASIIQSGLFLLPLTVTMFFFGLVSGRVAAAIGSKAAVIIGSIVSGVAYLILAFAHAQAWEIYTASALLGVGLGLAFSAMSNLIVQAVPPAQTGVASGMNANIRTIGGAFGAAVMSSIVTSQLLAERLPGRVGLYPGLRLPGGHDPGGGRGRHPHPDRRQTADRWCPRAPPRPRRAGPRPRWDPHRGLTLPDVDDPAVDGPARGPFRCARGRPRRTVAVRPRRRYWRPSRHRSVDSPVWTPPRGSSTTAGIARGVEEQLPAGPARSAPPGPRASARRGAARTSCGGWARLSFCQPTAGGPPT